VPLPKDVQDKNCLECHEDKTKGKAVHSAIQMGCSTCHSVKTEGEATTVELVAPKSELCFTCHEKSKEQVSHKPYQQGQCTTCHDPHTSDFAKQTRAEGNQLCLACHRDRRTTDAKVKLFGSQEISDTEFQQIPKISLDPSDKFYHQHFARILADGHLLLFDNGNGRPASEGAKPLVAARAPLASGWRSAMRLLRSVRRVMD